MNSKKNIASAHPPYMGTFKNKHPLSTGKIQHLQSRSPLRYNLQSLKKRCIPLATRSMGTEILGSQKGDKNTTIRSMGLAYIYLHLVVFVYGKCG